ncbi:MAG: alpha/beta fold hydrolase [Acidobacteriota bacterium]|nr:alpha/beta fold hydrolase [Acidobacteriota bacterium]
MTRFVLIPGAGGAAWYWSYVVERLQGAGHDATAVDLPGDDATAGLDDYTEMTLSVIDGRPDVVLVAQSLGGFTAAQVAARRRSPPPGRREPRSGRRSPRCRRRRPGSPWLPQPATIPAPRT